MEIEKTSVIILEKTKEGNIIIHSLEADKVNDKIKFSFKGKEFVNNIDLFKPIDIQIVKSSFFGLRKAKYKFPAYFIVYHNGNFKYPTIDDESILKAEGYNLETQMNVLENIKKANELFQAKKTWLDLIKENFPIIGMVLLVFAVVGVWIEMKGIAGKTAEMTKNINEVSDKLIRMQDNITNRQIQILNRLAQIVDKQGREIEALKRA